MRKKIKDEIYINRNRNRNINMDVNTVPNKEHKIMKSDPGSKFLYLLWIIIPHIYMTIFGKPTLPCCDWNFTSLFHGKPDYMTIYSNEDKKNKKVLFLVTGGFVLWYDVYLMSIVEDLKKTNVYENYEVIIIEKLDVCSIVMYDTFAYYIKELNIEKGGIEELVMIGFSSGGVIASQIMARLHEIDCKKKIITYDTPYQIVENIRRFTYNSFFRIDQWVMYGVVQSVYLNHYNYDEIKHHVVNNKPSENGANELIEMVKNVHGFNEESLLLNSGFNFDLTPETVVINTFSARDPFHNIHTTVDYLDINKDKVKFKNVFIKEDRCGHCTNMAFSTEYLKSILMALNIDGDGNGGNDMRFM